MNRLILIGNGFDLAHGLKTSYNDFIIWYLKNAFNKSYGDRVYEDPLLKILHRQHGRGFYVGALNNVDELVEHYYEKGLHHLFDDDYLNIEEQDYRNPFQITVKSTLLNVLLRTCSNVNWVDIENEFYNELKLVLQTDQNHKRSALLNLNQSLYYLIEYLQTYLLQLPSPLRDPGYEEIFTGVIRKDDVYDISFDNNEYPKDILALNFNYTPTLQKYHTIYNFESKQINLKVNHIHGKIGDGGNPLIFGFGDELDDDYQKIERETVKGYFEYIKSFWYLKTSHYRDLLRFIEADAFQIHVIGHSCGLSDRTMLHMIFEHKNCKSIRIFYHEQDNRTTNYTTLTHEIARHFKDKETMRNRIVPLDRSISMPQVR